MDLYRCCAASLLYSFFIIPTAHANLYAESWITTRNYLVSDNKIDATGNYRNSSGSIIQKSANFKIDRNLELAIADTMKNRILNNTNKNGNWSSAATHDVMRSLQDQKFIIDYDLKRIYKNSSDIDGQNCSFTNTSGFIVNYTHSIINNELYSCPKPAALAAALAIELQDTSLGKLTFVEFDNSNSNNTINSRAYFKYYDKSGVSRNYYITLSTPKRSDQTDTSTKVEITDDEMYQTVKQFKTALEDSMIDGNQYEKQSNKAYKILIDKLVGGNTDSNDSSIKPNPIDPTKPYDPSTNPSDGSFSLPNFCDYASVVCEFINWFKNDPEQAADENVSVKDEQYNHYWTEYFAVTAKCPQPILIDTVIDLKFTSERFYYEFEFTQLCNYAIQLKPFFMFAAYVACAFIVAGVRNG